MSFAPFSRSLIALISFALFSQGCASQVPGEVARGEVSSGEFASQDVSFERAPLDALPSTTDIESQEGVPDTKVGPEEHNRVQDVGHDVSVELEVEVEEQPEEGDIVSEEDAEPPAPVCTLLGAQCDDADCCTDNDLCVLCEGEACAPGELVCAGQALVCDDDQPCTEDLCVCETEDAGCVHEPLEDGALCDYSPNDCTTGDSCVAGQCILSPPIDLDDDNPCTEDSCEKGEVVHTFLLTGPCDDGDECTLSDHCELGLCVGGESVECVAQPCESSAYCVTGQGCVGVLLPVGAACDDGNPCTDDEFCTAEQLCASPSAPNCDDGNPCTIDSCDPDSGSCVNTPSDVLEGSLCSSDEACSGQGTCSGEVCVPLDPIDCEDDNPCTDTWCDAELGCQSSDNTAPCDDSDPGTCHDVCQGGLCVGELCEPTDPSLDEGDSCLAPIHLGDGGSFEVDLCDYTQDYTHGWCGMQGPELIFTLNVNYSSGSLQMSTAGSFDAIIVNYRWWSVGQCEDANSYSVNGFCYNGPAGIGWGGYDPEDILYFAVGSSTGECGPVVISATTVPSG